MSEHRALRFPMSFMLCAALLVACGDSKEKKSVNRSIDWEERKVINVLLDSLYRGSTYLPVYSSIYERNEKVSNSLTVTVSIRNTSIDEDIYITEANYYNTAGSLIRSYLTHPIYVKPMETIEIIVEEKDKEGGSGANFIFDWATREDTVEPLFEAVMITTSSTQGISFTTRGVRR